MPEAKHNYFPSTSNGCRRFLPSSGVCFAPYETYKRVTTNLWTVYGDFSSKVVEKTKQRGTWGNPGRLSCQPFNHMAQLSVASDHSPTWSVSITINYQNEGTDKGRNGRGAKMMPVRKMMATKLRREIRTSAIMIKQNVRLISRVCKSAGGRFIHAPSWKLAKNVSTNLYTMGTKYRDLSHWPRGRVIIQLCPN